MLELLQPFIKNFMVSTYPSDKSIFSILEDRSRLMKAMVCLEVFNLLTSERLRLIVIYEAESRHFRLCGIGLGYKRAFLLIEFWTPVIISPGSESHNAFDGNTDTDGSLV